MNPAREYLAINDESRHCPEYGCRKCIARARWNRRKKRRNRKKAARRNTGRK